MSPKPFFDSLNMVIDSRIRQNADQATFATNLEELKGWMSSPAYDVDKRAAILAALDTPHNPGWHYYASREWKKICKKKEEIKGGGLEVASLKGILETPVRGRMRLLGEVQGEIRDLQQGSFAQFDGTPWINAIEELKRHKSRLGDDTKWYEIDLVLNTAVTELFSHFDYTQRIRGTWRRGPLASGLTPAALLTKLGTEVPAELLDEPSSPQVDERGHSLRTQSHPTRAASVSPVPLDNLDLYEDPPHPSRSTASDARPRQHARAEEDPRTRQTVSVVPAANLSVIL
ncbi:hypothetical protein JCM16303_003096 [Sporobolomyces ruberrimus]